MKRFVGWGIALLLLGVPMLALLQAADCPQIVQSAFATTRNLCEATGRNQACYGNAQLEVELSPDYTDAVFSEPGDRLDVVALQTLRLSPMDVSAGTWGMSLMRVQANMRDLAQNLTLLVFGDVALSNAGTETTALDVTPITNANVRLLPSTNAGVVDVLRVGEIGSATGRLADDSWVRVVVSLGEEGALSGTGWVSADLLEDADLETLPVVDASARHYQPMQAFTFESGAESPCAEAPRSGILVQTPEGSARIRLLINGVDVDLGSTAFITAARGGDMMISLLEGSGAVTSRGITVPLFACTTITVALDENLEPQGAPSAPRPCATESLLLLPIGVLAEPIAIAPSLSDSQIAALLNPPSNTAPNSVPSFGGSGGSTGGSSGGGATVGGTSSGAATGSGSSGGGTCGGGSGGDDDDGGGCGGGDDDD